MFKLVQTGLNRLYPDNNLYVFTGPVSLSGLRGQEDDQRGNEI